jgi:hypothetical protein
MPLTIIQYKEKYLGEIKGEIDIFFAKSQIAYIITT